MKRLLILVCLLSMVVFVMHTSEAKDDRAREEIVLGFDRTADLYDELIIVLENVDVERLSDKEMEYQRALLSLAIDKRDEYEQMSNMIMNQLVLIDENLMETYKCVQDDQGTIRDLIIEIISNYEMKGDEEDETV